MYDHFEQTTTVEPELPVRLAGAVESFCDAAEKLSEKERAVMCRAIELLSQTCEPAMRGKGN